MRSATQSWLRRFAEKITADQVGSPLGLRISHREQLGLATHHTLQVKLAHQPLDGAAGHLDALPLQLPPELASDVHLEMLHADARDLGLELDVTSGRR